MVTWFWQLWVTFLAKDDVRGGVEESLRRLRLDYVDLLMIHCPWGFKVSTCYSRYTGDTPHGS